MRLPSRRKAGQHKERTRGQSVVEFALVVPLLLLLTMTAIDFGRVFLGWVGLNNAARVRRELRGAASKRKRLRPWPTPGSGLNT